MPVKKTETTTANTPEVSKAQRTIAILKAQPWMPQQGEMRTAALVTVRKQDDNYGGHIVLILENKEHGIFAYHVFSMLEQQSLSEIKPPKGSTLTLFNGGKRETNASKRAYVAYEELKKTYEEIGNKTALDALQEPERTFYHDNLIMEGDGTNLPIEDFSWE